VNDLEQIEKKILDLQETLQNAFINNSSSYIIEHLRENLTYLKEYREELLKSIKLFEETKPVSAKR